MFAAKRTENGSTNLTDDAAYLIKELGQPLREALTEVAIKKPRDPIEFIAHFLQHVVKTREYEIQAEEDFRLEQEFERELAEKRANALRLNNERKTIEAEKMAKEAQAKAEKAAAEAAKMEAERMALIQNLDGVQQTSEADGDESEPVREEEELGEADYDNADGGEPVAETAVIEEEEEATGGDEEDVDETPQTENDAAEVEEAAEESAQSAGEDNEDSDQAG